MISATADDFVPFRLPPRELTSISTREKLELIRMHARVFDNLYSYAGREEVMAAANRIIEIANSVPGDEEFPPGWSVKDKTEISK